MMEYVALVHLKHCSVWLDHSICQVKFEYADVYNWGVLWYVYVFCI